MEGMFAIIISIFFSLFVAWRLFFAKEVEVIGKRVSKAEDEQREVVFTDLEQLEYDYRAGKLDDELYNSERDKLIGDLADKGR